MKQQLKEKDPYSAGTYPSLLSRGLELPLSGGNPPGKQTLNTAPHNLTVPQSFHLGALAFCTTDTPSLQAEPPAKDTAVLRKQR